MSEEVNREHKDRLFCFIFGRAENKAWTLSLYNAVNGTAYTDPADIEITTMEDVIYMGMKNDVSFLIGDDISLYEHQSTYNPNMPMRQLMYLGRQYDKYIKQSEKSIYSRKQLQLPVPKLVTFYNGLTDVPDKVLYLKDSFPEGTDPDQADVTVRVHMYNVRPQYKSRLLEMSRPLSEYSRFIDEIQQNRRTMELDPAIRKAINDLPEDFEIRPFLIAHQSEVYSMCLTEYNEAETMEYLKKEAREEGLEEGRAEGGDQKLTRLVWRKLRKSMAPSEIAEVLEEDGAHIQKICDALAGLSPDLGEDQVIRRLWPA